MFYFLLTIFSVLFAYLSWRRISWAVALVVFALPSYLIRFQAGPIPMTLLELMILILFAIFIIQKFKNSTPNHVGFGVAMHPTWCMAKIQEFKNLKLGSWFWLVIAWLLVATLAMLVSPDLRAAAGIWKAYFIEPILFLIVFINTIKTRNDLNLVFKFLGLSVFIVSLLAIYQKIAGLGVLSLENWPDQLVRRVASIFPDPNFLGLYLAPLIVLLFATSLDILRRRKMNLAFLSCFLSASGRGGRSVWVKFFAFLLFCFFAFLSLLAVIFSRCEGALVGITAGLIFIGLLWRASRRWVLISMAIGLIIILAVAPIRSFIFTKATFQDISGQARLNIWRETAVMLSERPLIGTGLAGYQSIMEKYHQPFLSKKLPLNLDIHPYPHNIFLSVWAELGFFGLLVFLLIVIQFFRQGFKNFSWLSLSIMGAMVCLLIHGLVDTPYFKNDLSVLFWLIIGMMINIKYFR